MAEVAEPNAPSQEGACGENDTVQGDIKSIQETLQVILKKIGTNGQYEASTDRTYKQPG